MNNQFLSVGNWQNKRKKVQRYKYWYIKDNVDLYVECFSIFGNKFKKKQVQRYIV